MKIKPEEKAMYDASYTDVFFKNFLVGFARGLGGFAVQIVFFLFLYFSFLQFVYPKLEPFLNAFVKAQETMSAIKNPSNFFDNLFQTDDSTVKLDTPKKTQ